MWQADKGVLRLCYLSLTVYMATTIASEARTLLGWNDVSEILANALERHCTFSSPPVPGEQHEVTTLAARCIKMMEASPSLSMKALRDALYRLCHETEPNMEAVE